MLGNLHLPVNDTLDGSEASMKVQRTFCMGTHPCKTPSRTFAYREVLHTAWVQYAKLCVSPAPPVVVCGRTWGGVYKCIQYESRTGTAGGHTCDRVSYEALCLISQLPTDSQRTALVFPIAATQVRPKGKPLQIQSKDWIKVANPG